MKTSLSPHNIVTFAVAALLSLSACGTDNGSAGSTGGTSITIEALPTLTAEAMCDMQERCGKDGVFPITFSSKAACVENLKASMLSSMDEIAAVKDGKMVFDGKKAAACMALMKTMACGDLDMDTNETCDSVFAGTIESDKACDESKHCATGWCAGANAPSQGCPGKCAAAKKEGEACESQSNDECAGALACIDKKCAKRTAAKDGESCAGGRPCAAGLYCPETPDPVCAKQAATGEACKTSSACTKGLRCAADKCAAPGKEGETCSASAGFGPSPECEKGLSCAMLFEGGVPKSQTCMKSAALGAACTAVFECGGFDLYCKAKKCESLPKVGEACADKADAPMFQCQFGLKCGTDGKCKADGDAQEGESCASDSCAGGLSCNAKQLCEKAAAPVCS
ncbi:MAG: hypothetical protein KC502_08630 [Myxococcales bacterium]|nr:hypothetical protein [Myxococcales bacterium]